MANSTGLGCMHQHSSLFSWRRPQVDVEQGVEELDSLMNGNDRGGEVSIMEWKKRIG